jgi:hypothetical protein
MTLTSNGQRLWRRTGGSRRCRGSVPAATASTTPLRGVSCSLQITGAAGSIGGARGGGVSVECGCVADHAGRRRRRRAVARGRKRRRRRWGGADSVARGRRRRRVGRCRADWSASARMTDPAVVRLDGAWTVRREAEPPPLPREMKVGGRVWEWGAGCEGNERAGKKDPGQGRDGRSRRRRGVDRRRRGLISGADSGRRRRRGSPG